MQSKQSLTPLRGTKQSLTPLRGTKQSLTPLRGTKGFAALPILLVIAVALSVGAYFVYRERTQQPSAPEEREIQEIRSQGTSDEPEAIEADLEATSYTEIDSDLQQIEAELDAALEAQ